MSFGRLSGALLLACVWGAAAAAPSPSAPAEPGISRAVEVPPPKGWHPDMPLFAPQPEVKADRAAKSVVKASDRRAAVERGSERPRRVADKALPGAKRPQAGKGPLAGKGLAAARAQGVGREARKPGRPGVSQLAPAVRAKAGAKSVAKPLAKATGKVGAKAVAEAPAKAAAKAAAKDVRKGVRKPGRTSAQPSPRASRQPSSPPRAQKASPRKSSPKENSPKESGSKRNSRPG